MISSESQPGLSSDPFQAANGILASVRNVAQSAKRVELLEETRSILIDARRARLSPTNCRDLFRALCTVSATDSDPAVRCTALATVEDLCLRELPLFVVDATQFLVNALQDVHVKVRARAIRAVTSVFRKVLGLAYLLGVTNAVIDPQTPQYPSQLYSVEGLLVKLPESCLHQWLEMRDRALQSMQHSHDGLCKAAIKFAETVVLAQSYSGSGSHGSHEHFTLDFAQSRISSCPMLSLPDLQAYGSTTVANLAQFVSQPLQMPSSVVAPHIRPNPYITAITVLANLARRRRLLLDFTLPPLIEASRALVNIVNPHPAVSALSKGQRTSIVTVLRLCEQSIKSCNHVRASHFAESLGTVLKGLDQYKAREVGSAMQQKRQEAPLHKPHPEMPTKAISLQPAAKNQSEQSKPRASTANSRKRAREELLPSPMDAAKGADVLFRTRVYSDLVGLVFDAIRRVRPRASAAQSSNERSVEKKPRGSRFGAVSTPVANDSEKATGARKIVPRRAVAPPVVVPKMDAQSRQRLLRMLCRRLVRCENTARYSGAYWLRILSLAKLLPLATAHHFSDSASFVQEIIEYILENLMDRFELAMAWLNEEAASGLLQSRTLADSPASALLMDDNDASKEDSKPADSFAHAKEEDSLDADSESCLMEPERELSASSEQTIARDESEGTASRAVVLANGLSVDGDVNPASDSADHSIDGAVSLQELMSVSGKYEQIFVALLTAATAKLGPEDRMFTRLLVEAPCIPDKALEVVSLDCRDPARSRLGLCTLRDIIYERPGLDRDRCLNALFALTCDVDDVVRGPAIRMVADKIFLDGSSSVRDRIEDHAVRLFKASISLLPSDEKNLLDSSDLNTGDNFTSKVKRNTALLTALCTKKPTLLSHFATVYVDASLPARTVILDRAGEVGRHLGSEAQFLSDLMASDRETDNARVLLLNDFFLKVVQAAFSKAGFHISAELADVLRMRYDRTKDKRLLVLAVSGFERKEFLRYMPVLLASEADVGGPHEEDLQSSVKDVLRRAMLRRTPIISPSELIVEIHSLKANPGLCIALKTCLEMKTIFRDEDVAIALQRLILIHPTPVLIMQTALLARMHHPNLDRYIRETVLSSPLGLISRRIWESSMLWSGFIQYCESSKDGCISLIATLPERQISDVLSGRPKLCKAVKSFLEADENKSKRCCQIALTRAVCKGNSVAVQGNAT